jgi:hypothetical protein
MRYRIIFKDFKSNMKNNILFFLANSVGVAEFFVFWGMYSVMAQILKGGVDGESSAYDIALSVGAVTIFSTALMVYSMTKYIRVRIHSYSLFVIIGMKKRVMYAMMAFEYLVGWLVSSGLGLLAGTALLKGVLYGWHFAFPEYVGAAKVNVSVYQMTFRVSLGIMAAVLFILLVWTDNRELGSLMAGEETKEKRPRSMCWLVMVFAGILLLLVGRFQYSGSVVRGWPFVYAHMEWIGGAFLILMFGGGIVLEMLHGRENFYMSHILKLNRLYSKYQSNSLVLLMLLAVHFLALSYCVAGMAEMFPMGDYERHYPYDAVWMAQEREEDRAFCDGLAEKYGGEAKEMPMIRVTNYFNAEHIGISASAYKELTKRDARLEGREVICAVSECKSLPGKPVSSGMYEELNEWMVPGRLTKELNEQINDPNSVLLEMDKENLFEIKEVHTQNWFGEYGIMDYCEDVIVFSDAYFEEQRGRLLNNPEEATVLAMFAFPEENKRKALGELRSYVKKHGVKDSEWTSSRQRSLYITEETVEELEKADLFKLTNKLFIMATLFLSGMFALMIKTLSEIPYYERRYEFLECMGIRKKMRKKTLSAEIQSTPAIAVTAAFALSAPYLWMHILREDARGVVLGGKVWLYWAVIAGAYVAAEYGVQKVFVGYAGRRIERKC